jgi:hypothetical protein
MQGYYTSLPLSRELAFVEGWEKVNSTYIGAIPWVGSGEGYKLLENLILALHEKTHFLFRSSSFP